MHACVYIVWGSRWDQEGEDNELARGSDRDGKRVYDGVRGCRGTCRCRPCKLVAVSLSEGRREGGKIRNRAYTARARDDVVLAKRGRRTGGQTIRCV